MAPNETISEWEHSVSEIVEGDAGRKPGIWDPPRSIRTEKAGETKPGRSLIVRHAVFAVAFIALYLLLSQPYIIVISRIGLVGWYPAIGLAVAVMLIVSPWYALLVCVSIALSGALVYQQPVKSFGETVGALGIAVCYGAAAYVLRGRWQIDLQLRRRRDVARYVLVCLTAAGAATLVGTTCLVADHSIGWGEYWSSAVLWFSGDAVGLLAVAPFLLVKVFPPVGRWLCAESPEPETTIERLSERKSSVAALAEGVGQVAAVAAVLWVMFGARFGSYDHFYVSFVPIIWVAMRQGIRRAVSALLALNFGIVVAMHFVPPSPAQLGKVSLLMLVVSAAGLIVASEVSERFHTAAYLNEQSTYLNLLIQNSPFGIVAFDQRGQVELVNGVFDKLFRDEGNDFTSYSVQSLFVTRGVASESLRLLPQVLAGKRLHLTVRQRRKAGKILDLELHAIPLVVDGRVRGAYAIYEDVSEQVRAAEVEQRHSDSLNELVQELKLRAQKMTSLNEMAGLLECCATSQDACTVVGHSLQKLFPEALAGTLYVLKPSLNLIETGAQWGKSGLSEPVFLRDDCWGLRRGQANWSGNADHGINCKHVTDVSRASFLCVPMMAQGETLGVLHLAFPKTINSPDSPGADVFEESRHRLAITVAGQIALSLASLRLREALRDQSIRDSLTGLFNRRFMEESLGRELQLAGRKNYSISVLFLDLDHFKRFNDTWGHDAGDMVLRTVADLLTRFFRATDVCCRYGGEEFAIILPESPQQEAFLRAQALCSEIKGLNLEYENQMLGPITASVGVAGFPEHGRTPEELLRSADQALYESKSRGRDAVTVATGNRWPRT